MSLIVTVVVVCAVGAYFDCSPQLSKFRKEARAAATPTAVLSIAEGSAHGIATEMARRTAARIRYAHARSRACKNS